MSARKCFLIAFAVVLSGLSTGFGQQGNERPSRNQSHGGLPSVSDLVKKLDRNRDGKLTKDEVTQAPYSRNFSRWDTDKNGNVTEAEIGNFRKRLGIPVEGTAESPNRPRPQANAAVAKLTIPEVSDLLRVGRGTRPSPQEMRNSAFVLKTQAHAVGGDKYVILTDHSQQGYLKSLQRLAKHRDGIIVQVSDLALLHKSEAEMADVRKQLQDAKVRFLAIAPRMETFRENMLLGMWELISTIDSDPQLDAFPGILLATTEEDFAGLIERSISYMPQPAKEVRPFAISQVPSTRELRSLQKSGILRNLFAEYGCSTPTVGIYSSRSAGAPKLPGDQFWRYESKNRGDFLKEFPDAAGREFEKASLLVMHGHGVPGMSCGVDLAAIPKGLSAQVILCGSCFAAAPKKSDFPEMRQAPGGYGVEARDAFAVRAIDHGACVVFGHMRLSQGFPHLFPVLETWLKGKSVGEAYQQLMNGLIDMQGTKSGGFVVTEEPANGRQPRQNSLLYVVFGDPAVQPFEQMIR